MPPTPNDLRQRCAIFCTETYFVTNLVHGMCRQSSRIAWEREGAMPLLFELNKLRIRSCKHCKVASTLVPLSYWRDDFQMAVNSHSGGKQCCKIKWIRCIFYSCFQCETSPGLLTQEKQIYKSKRTSSSASIFT